MNQLYHFLSKVLVIGMTISLTFCKTQPSVTLIPSDDKKTAKVVHDMTALFDVKELFTDERFPNVVVAMDGSIVCSWGSQNIRVRRSEDGGETWLPDIQITKGIQGGGMIVDESNGDILLFVEDSHPVSPAHQFRSQDHGKTWTEEALIIKPNSLGHIPSMHMNEHGIYVQHGEYKNRLIRATRYYDEGNDKLYWDKHYTNAMYSDDHGRTWQASEAFPVFGMGEAAIAELSDGQLYYNSRRHKSTDGQTPLKRYEAQSLDGGKTWQNISINMTLPDGSQHRDYGLMGGLTTLRDEKGNTLLFSNIVSSDGRKNGTVWLSTDSGKSWPFQKVIDKGSFAYSSLNSGRVGTPSEGMMFLFYESENGGKIARFNMPWLLLKNN